MRQRTFLAHVAPEDFTGRADELARVRAHVEADEPRLLLLLTAPAVGSSELLRQTYDALFAQADGVLPIYFACGHERTAVQAARRFSQTFLSQFVAYQRREPALCHALLSAREVVELAPLADQEWLERYLEALRQVWQDADETEFVRLCLSAPQRARQQGTSLCVLLDHLHAAAYPCDGTPLAEQFLTLWTRAGVPAVVAGLRRSVTELAQFTTLEEVATLPLEPLAESDAQTLLARLAEQAGVPLNDPTRDLIVQQTAGSPVFMRALAEAAREQGVALDSFRRCQELYAGELLDGRISRYFSSIWDDITPHPAASRALLRLLYENAALGRRHGTVDNWCQRLRLDEAAGGRLVNALHAHEWLVLQGQQVELSGAPRVWHDYLELRYRLEVEGAPRALVLADALSEFLKRAPRALTQQYRRAAVPPVRETLTRWDGQQVPRSLLDAQEFQELYEDFEPEEIGPGLDEEQNFITLPQVIHVASHAAYTQALALAGSAESCLVAHGFEAGRYTDADEVIWLAAHVESKNAAKRELVKNWHASLLRFAGAVGFDTVRLWLVSPSGFAPDALAYLTRHALYGSNALQWEHLRQRLNALPKSAASPEAFELELVLPMEENAELLAVHTLEQIAERVSMPAEVVGQIKTALVEACINATEHSHSPERKIYQKFRATPGQLTVTVASRGVALSHLSDANLKHHSNNGRGAMPQRRGWGLKLIRSLMDEVEFERVDDGTRLRMTKYFSA